MLIQHHQGPLSTDNSPLRPSSRSQGQGCRNQASLIYLFLGRAEIFDTHSSILLLRHGPEQIARLTRDDVQADVHHANTMT